MPAVDTPIARESAPVKNVKSDKLAPKKKKWKPKNYHKMAAKPGQAPSDGTKPSLLCDEIEERICQFLRGGASLVDSATLVGINSVTVTDWRARGSQEPQSRYGQFYRKTEEARTHWKVRGIIRMTQSDDLRHTWRLLCSRYPTEFRNFFSAELSGPQGTPIPLAVEPFSVTVVLSTDEAQQQPPDFQIRSHANGNGA
jgi:hypothetical protein